MEYVIRIICFLVFSSVIMNILPDNNYKKYIRLFMGTLLIILVMKPFVNLNELQIDYFNKYDYNQIVNEMEEKISRESNTNINGSMEAAIRVRLAKEDISVRKINVTLEEDEITNIGIQTTLGSREKKNEIVKILSDYYQIPAEYIEVK